MCSAGWVDEGLVGLPHKGPIALIASMPGGGEDRGNTAWFMLEALSVVMFLRMF